MNDFTGWSKGLTVTADGDAVISHAGAAALRLTADRAGLTKAPSRALRRDGFTPGHDRGRVLTDTAVMMADGGNTVRGIDVLRHQRDLLGDVASPATLSRALAEVDQANPGPYRHHPRRRTHAGVGPHRRPPRRHPTRPGAQRRPRYPDRAAYRRALHRRLLPSGTRWAATRPLRPAPDGGAG